MKKAIALIIGLILSCLIVFVLPKVTSNVYANNLNSINEVSQVKQGILGYGDTNTTYYKLYYNNDLIGILHNLDYFNSIINNNDYAFENDFGDIQLGLINDCYIVDETSNIIFEDLDKEIAEFVIENKYVGIQTTAVEFSTNEGVYDIIYVANKDDFISARDMFLENFISNESLTKISNKEEIASPSDFGSVEKNLEIKETMTFTESVVYPDNIFMSVNEIYNYLCYGRNETRQYYETKVGDTVQAVGYYFGDMSAKQIMMLNPDIIFDEDQILAPGTVLNVTYYQSPITVVVTKERLYQQTVLPDSPSYVDDDELEMGKRKIIQEEENGLRNVLYKETWVNGVIQDGEELSSSIVKEAVQGIIAVGTMAGRDVGTGNWRFPVDNPIITCNYTCYYAHGGVDFQNMYARWDNVYAADAGKVIAVGWTDIGGYYVRIDHNNGFITYYGHMRTYPYVAVDQIVDRGDILGPIGMTGNASGPHVHFAMYHNDVLIDPCTQLACGLALWG